MALKLGNIICLAENYLIPRLVSIGSQPKQAIQEYDLHGTKEHISLEGLLVMRNLDSYKCLMQMNFREWLDST